MNNDLTLLEAKNVAAGYGNHIVLTGVSFQLQRGESLAIVGQNGSGKSTLLKAVCGLLPLLKGGIWVEGKAIHKIRTHELLAHGISYFVQGGLAMPDLTVKEHLDLAARQNGINDLQWTFDTVHDYFPRLKRLHRERVGNLSGGERHLLSLGILLAQRTHIWLLDEPTAGLAPEMVEFTADFLRQQNEDGTSLIIVEHNMEVAFKQANHVLVAKEGTLTGKYDRQHFSADGFLEKVVYS